MAAIHMEKTTKSKFDSDLDQDQSDEDSASDDEIQKRLGGSGSDASAESDNDSDVEKSNKLGMANVVSRILSKDVSKSTRILLAKGKTDKEINSDIARRKRQREESSGDFRPTKTKSSKVKSTESEFFKEEKRKIWESMGRQKPSALDNAKELRLRKIATQGMVQLFRSVHEHQKMMNQKLSSVGASESRKDKVMQEFTKGKFLDLLKGKKAATEAKSAQKAEKEGKWKILQDDFMMGAQMKDWDKEEEDDDDDEEGLEYKESMEADDVLLDED